MRIIRLQAEGFKRLHAVDITPDGALVGLGGDNGEGKSSVLDAIYAAIGGAEALPIKPVRTGEEAAVIRLDIGDMVVTRTFTAEGTETLKLQTPEGASFDKPQTRLDDLVGALSFDPLAFARMRPEDQAAELRRLAPLSIDLDALAKADNDDRLARRDVNRDAKALKARIEAINISGIVPERPDRDAIVAAMSSAGETNAAIQRDRVDRDRRGREQAETSERVARWRDEAAALLRKADAEQDAWYAEDKALKALPPLPEPVDTAKLSEDLAAADRDLALLARIDERKRLVAEFGTLETRSKAFTQAMADRAAQRAKALAAAPIPVEGLGLARACDVIPGNESEGLIVVHNGEPFAQSSTAQQIRVSAQLAAAMSPKLRVMIVREGAFLDSKGMEMLRAFAEENDFQIWLETVGEREGVGIIMQDGRVRGAPEPEPLPKPRQRKAKDEADVATVVQNMREADAGPVATDAERDRQAAAPATPATPAPDAPARPKPRAMRSFSSKPLGGDLFGGDK